MPVTRIVALSADRGLPGLTLPLITLVLIASLLGSASPAEAHWEQPWSWYSMKKGCTTRVDPITFIFKGTQAGVYNAADKVQAATGWTPSGGGGDSQAFHTHGDCRGYEAQRASGGATSSRYHVRFFWAHDGYDGDEKYSVATPHYEIYRGGCHFVPSGDPSGFTIGKQALRNALKGRYNLWNAYVGNSEPILQGCSRTWAGNNNGVVWVAELGLLCPCLPAPDLLTPLRESFPSLDLIPAAPVPSEVEPIANDAVRCSSVSEPLEFRNFWAGSSFDGLPLTAVIRDCTVPDPAEGPFRANSVSYVYGTCDPELDGCAPPIVVQSWPSQDRNKNMYAAAEREGFLTGVDGSVGGVPATWYEGGSRLEIWHPDVTVVVFGYDSTQIERFALGLTQGPGVLTDLQAHGITFNPDCLYDQNYCATQP